MRPGRGARLPVVEGTPRPAIDRSRDRRVTFAGLVVAGGFLAAALGSLLLPDDVRLGWWLPLHLALAGAAGSAIAAMLPFFVAALRVAPPGPAALHGGAIALIGLGAALAAIGRGTSAAVPNPLAATGAALYVAGAGATALAAGWSLRQASGPRRPTVEVAYGLGLASVVVGAALASLYLAGTPAVIADWPRLRVTHAWLNAFGFLGLIVTGTLIHFAPTIVGARIRPRPSGDLAVGALALGPLAVAGGVAWNLDAVSRLGALATVLGGAALVVHGSRVQRDATGWTTEAAWHRFTSGSLLVAPVWLLVATGLAGLPVIVQGAQPTAWRLEPLLPPLAAGFVVQILLGALTHLVPAIGPGGPERHARARRILGRDATLRLVAWNAGVALLTITFGGVAPTPLPPQLIAPLLAAGAALLVTSLGAALVLLALCLSDRR